MRMLIPMLVNYFVGKVLPAALLILSLVFVQGGPSRHILDINADRKQLMFIAN